MDRQHHHDSEEEQLGRSASERAMLMVGAGLALLAFVVPPLLMVMGVLQQQIIPRQEPQTGQLS